MANEKPKLTEAEKDALLDAMLPAVLEGVTAFFQGKAALMIGSLENGIAVRFKRDA